MTGKDTYSLANGCIFTASVPVDWSLLLSAGYGQGCAMHMLTLISANTERVLPAKLIRRKLIFAGSSKGKLNCECDFFLL